MHLPSGNHIPVIGCVCATVIASYEITVINAGRDLRDSRLASDKDLRRELSGVFFTTLAGFTEHTFLPGFILEASAGGFHDPIGERGYSGIWVIRDTLVISLFGGSAWKWQTREHYLYDAGRDAFFLVKRQGREFHASTLVIAEGELLELEKIMANGGSLDRDQEQERMRLEKVVADAGWKTTVYRIGEIRLGEVE